MQCAPDSKGKVERPIRYVRQSFFYGREFLNDADLKRTGTVLDAPDRQRSSAPQDP